MKEIMKERIKSWGMWVSVAGALWVILTAFGVTGRMGIAEGTFKTVLDAVGTILTAFGIVNDPTNRTGL